MTEFKINLFITTGAFKWLLNSKQKLCKCGSPAYSMSECFHSFTQLDKWTNVGNSEWGYTGDFEHSICLYESVIESFI